MYSVITRSTLAALFVGTIFLTSHALGEDQKIPYPENYTQTYTNYLTLDRTQNPDQIIRLFANDVALQGPGDDGKLPFGSVVVAEIYSAKKDAEGAVITSSLGQRIQDQLALIAVMQREEGWGAEHPPALSNGNWEMATFKPDGSGESAGKDLNACRACHAPLTDKNFLFSYEHLGGK